MAKDLEIGEIVVVNTNYEKKVSTGRSDLLDKLALNRKKPGSVGEVILTFSSDDREICLVHHKSDCVNVTAMYLEEELDRA